MLNYGCTLPLMWWWGLNLAGFLPTELHPQSQLLNLIHMEIILDLDDCTWEDPEKPKTYLYSHCLPTAWHFHYLDNLRDAWLLMGVTICGPLLVYRDVRYFHVVGHLSLCHRKGNQTLVPGWPRISTHVAAYVRIPPLSSTTLCGHVHKWTNVSADTCFQLLGCIHPQENWVDVVARPLSLSTHLAETDRSLGVQGQL